MSHDLLVQMAYNTQLCHTGDDGTTIKQLCPPYKPEKYNRPLSCHWRNVKSLLVIIKR